MAFVLEHSWQAARARRLLRSWPGAGPLSALGGRWRRDAVGLLGTALVHALLFVAIILRVFASAEPRVKLPGSSLKLVELSTSTTISALADRSVQASLPPLAASSPPLVVRPSLEWSVRRIAEAVVIAENTGGAARSGQSGPPGEAAGAGGGYDPYAGAAPMRDGSFGLSSAVAASQPSASKAAEADVASLLGAKLIAVARSRYPSIHGIGTFLILLDGRGMIVSAHLKSGTLSVADALRLTTLLLDASLESTGIITKRLVVGPLNF